MSKLESITNENFTKLVNISDSIVDLQKRIGYGTSSGSVGKNIKKRIRELNLSVDHFTKSKSKRLENIGKSSYTLNEILIENSNYLNRGRLKIRLVKEGVLEYKCSCCNNKGEWLGKPITLQLDHINGICNDNRLFNLRFLCPNCHSQTETYSGKNIKK